MMPHKATATAIALSTAAVLGSEVLSYALVYPARPHGTRLGLMLALIAGSAMAGLASLISWRALHRSSRSADRFFALLGFVISLFFLFVLVAGFGIPQLILSPKD